MTNTNNPDSEGFNGFDQTANSLKEKWMAALRTRENREATFSERLLADKERAELVKERVLNLADSRRTEYEQDREALRKQIELNKQNLVAAHNTARTQCKEIGLQYRPGETTERDVLSVPCIQRSQAAETLNMKHGHQTAKRWRSVAHWILAGLCCAVSIISFMGILGASLKNPAQHPAVLLGSIILGIGLTVGIKLLVEPAWNQVGARVGSGRPDQEVTGSKLTALAVTILVLIGVLLVDGYGLIALNRARAAYNPAYALSLPLAMVIAGAINFCYILSAAFKGFSVGYQECSTTRISDFIRSDELKQQEDRKRDVNVQASLDALSLVAVVEKQVERTKRELQILETEFSDATTKLLASVPSTPNRYSEEEEKELRLLDHQIVIAKNEYDAHVSSRSVAPGNSRMEVL